MDQHDLERIARATLKELGISSPDLTVTPVAAQPGSWRIELRDPAHGPSTLTVRCGLGSTAQWVREQIFNQLTQS